MMVLWFKPLTDVRIKRFQGPRNLPKHLFAWMEQWCDRTAEEWVHLFIHALGPIHAAWYLDAEIHQCTRQWKTLEEEFLGTFGLTRGLEVLEEALQTIDTFVSDESSLDAIREGPIQDTQMQDNFEFHKATMKNCDADLRKVSIIESGGEHTVAGPLIHKVGGMKPLKP